MAIIIEEKANVTIRREVGELVGNFAARSFEVNGKTITGLDVVLLIKQYVADLHAESEAPVQ